MGSVAVEGTYLEDIVAWHRNRAAKDPRSRKDLRNEALKCVAAPSFGEALRSSDDVSLIAECKRRSPSRGDLAQIADPVALGMAYQSGGAAAVSVLTDAEFFLGSLNDLSAIASELTIPCLRKDFTVDVIDLYDAKLNGAAAVLLIVAALTESELATFLIEASEIGLCALVETHSEAEIELANEVGADIIGVNQRNLGDFSIDTELGEKLVALIDSTRTKVLESGIVEPQQVRHAARAGFDAVLIGEALVRQASVVEATSGFVLAGKPRA